jgi:small-conductance mechanosensitive channel
MWDKYKGFVYGFLSIIIIMVIYKIMVSMLRKYAKKHNFSEEHAISFIRYWQYGYLFIATIIVVVSFSGEIQALGITLGFIGSIMAWMLSAPVKNMAGWLFLITTRPFKVGDRIIIGDVIGDVMDITINYIILDQVGGTTVGEDKSGRGVLVPTSWLFDRLINNYSMRLPSDESNSKYLLDEIVVRITYDSHWDTAESILMDCAKEVTANVIAETGQEPYIRAEFFPSGVFMRIRYQVAPTDRQRVWYEIVKLVSQKVNENENVSYGFNKANVIVSCPEGQSYPPQHPSWFYNGELKK